MDKSARKSTNLSYKPWFLASCTHHSGSLAFQGLQICFHIYHIDSTQRQDTLEKEVSKDTHG
jgi:hypothetical protein